MPTQITGGRNGYGAKLANIFSTSFSVETCDGRRQKRFKMTWKDNMSSKSDPKACGRLEWAAGQHAACRRWA